MKTLWLNPARTFRTSLTVRCFLGTSMSAPQCLGINMQEENEIDDIRTVTEKIKGFYVSVLVISLIIKVFIRSGAGSSFMPKLVPRLAYNWHAWDLNGPISIQQAAKTDQWLMTNFTRVFQPMPSWLNWPIVLNGPDLQQHRLTNTIHLTLKMTSAQVVETSVTNNSFFQNYTHRDDHTIRTTDTPRFVPFT